MKPEDTIWRILERLQESEQIFGESIKGLHPKHDKGLIDAITEVEQLTRTQINICRRAQRRLDKSGR